MLQIGRVHHIFNILTPKQEKPIYAIIPSNKLHEMKHQPNTDYIETKVVQMNRDFTSKGEA